MVFVVTSMISCNAQAPKASLKTEIDSLSYANGVNFTQGLSQYLQQQLGIEESQMDDFIKGFIKGFNTKKDDKKVIAYTNGVTLGQQVNGMLNNTNSQLFGSDSTKTLNKKDFLAGFLAATVDKDLLITKEEAQTYATTVGEKIRNEEFEKQNATAKVDNAKFLEENGKKEGVITLPSGLQYKVISEGNGPKPVATDKVEVDYVGKLIDGTEFDSSVTRGEHATFGLNQVIAGWTEGIQLMSVGSKYEFYIPYHLAYGEQGRPGSIPAYATLIFEVDLYNIEK
jgi:FKBP-type peptidyl-prolyl cis-trans isomerase FklB